MANDFTIQVGADTSRANRDINRFASSLPLGRITRDLSQFDRSLDAATARVTAFGATALVFGTVTKGIKELVSATVGVEKSLTDINVVFNASTKNLTKFGHELFNIAKNTGKSFQEVAEGAVELSRQGLGLEKTLLRTRDAMILSRLAGIDSLSSVEALTAAINSFSDAALDSTTIVNKFAKVDAAFAVSSRDLAEAVKRVGSTAQDAGLNIDELISLVTALQQTTARGGAVIGNSLKTILTRIQRPDVLDQLELVGVRVRDTQDSLLPTIDILRNLAVAYDGLSESQKSQVGELAGGVYQINQLKAGLKDLASINSVYKRALDVSNKATDEAIQRNERLNQTLSALLNTTRQSFLQFGAGVGQLTVNPLASTLLNGVGVIPGFNDLLQGMVSKKTENAGEILGKGLFQGLADYISGPGAILIGAILLSIFKKIGKDVGTALGTLLGANPVNKDPKHLANLAQMQVMGLISSTGAVDIDKSRKQLASLRGSMGTTQKQINALTSQAGPLARVPIDQLSGQNIAGFMELQRRERLEAARQRMLQLQQTAAPIAAALPVAIREQRLRRIGTMGMIGSFAVPPLANMAGQYYFGGEGRFNRVGRSVAAGVGDVASYGLTGAALGAFGGNPLLGLGAGLAVGGVTSINRTLSEFSTVLPEFQQKTERAIEAFERFTEDFQLFREVADLINKANTGQITLSAAQRATIVGRANLALQRQGNAPDILKALTTGDIETLNLLEGRFGANILNRRDMSQITAELVRAGEEGGDIDPIVRAILSFGGGKLSKAITTNPDFGTFLRGSIANPDSAAKALGQAMELSVGDQGLLYQGLNRLAQKNPAAFSTLLSRLGSGAELSTQNIGQIERAFGGSMFNPRASLDKLAQQLSIGGALRGISGENTLSNLQNSLTTFRALTELTRAYDQTQLNPQQLIRLAGRDDILDIQKQGQLSLLGARGGIAAGVSKPFEGFLRQLPNIDERLGFKVTQGFTRDFQGRLDAIAAGEPGAMEGMQQHIRNFMVVMSRLNMGVAKQLMPTIQEMEIVLKEGIAQEERLKNAIEAEVDASKKLTEAKLALADPINQAKIAAIDFHTQLKQDVALNKVFQKEGLLFSDQYAASQLSIRQRQVLTGDISGRGVFGAAGQSFTEQLSFGAKDLYRDLIIGAAEVGDALKSSFKDAFKSFIDGTNSAEDALRSLGLSFFNAILNRTVDTSINMILGGIQSFGSYAIASYRAGKASGGLIKRYAGGGLIQGGSGVRDDIPMMLSEGSYVVRKSSVNKYGVNLLNALQGFANGGNVRTNLRNRYSYDNPTHPTSGSLDVDPLLSNFALTDENNPQNQLRMNREVALTQYISDRNSYYAQVRQAKKDFENAKRQRIIGAFISAGLGIAGAGLIGRFGNARPSGYVGDINVNPQLAGMAAMGGLATRQGFKRYAMGGRGDNVPALVMGGEYIFNREAVNRLGVPFLNKLNSGQLRFANGGLAGNSMMLNAAPNQFNDNLLRLFTAIDQLKNTFEKTNGRPTIGESSSPASQNNNITINVHIDRNGDVRSNVSSDTNKPENPNNDADRGRQIGEVVNAAVLQALIKESRPNGLLERTFEKRRG